MTDSTQQEPTEVQPGETLPETFPEEIIPDETEGQPDGDTTAGDDNDETAKQHTWD